ncbi:hypothetical protein [Maribacter litoralis]|uniref:YD repeat-containing protein n=1 Tax=Maribacter litoralis TaxID=2059726 RepID=A0A653TWQ7_9FLAO|nr:hypothetical protein [Maribacter litoralis]VXB85181.1 conserved hypothetical protein [Maribacter litoralis]
MKRLFLYIFFATSICNAQQTKMRENNKTDLEKLNLTGKVKSVKEFTQISTNKDSLILDTEKEFNVNGFLIKETVYSYGNIHSVTEYNYINDKLNTETEKIIGPNGYTTFTNYFYKENEIESKSFEDDELVESSIVKIDKNNNVVYSKNNNNLFGTFCEKNFVYNQNNQLTTMTESCYNEDGKNYGNTITYTYVDGLLQKMKHSNTITNDEVGFEERYAYDSSNNCIEIKVYIKNVLESRQSMTYKNALLEEHHFSEKGKEIKSIIYKYNSKKNVNMKTINEVGSVATITTVYIYEMEYYK